MINIELIEECRKGNFNNFRKLVELTSPFAFSVAFRMLGDEDLAKDVIQETMVTIWQKIRNIKTAEVYNRWVYRIVLNKCYDHLRRRQKTREYSADAKLWAFLSDSISQTPFSQLENDDNAKIIGILTERLSPKQKAVFILSELEEMSGDEIAEITGYSKSAIKANLHHARKTISEMVEKYL